MINKLYKELLHDLIDYREQIAELQTTQAKICNPDEFNQGKNKAYKMALFILDLRTQKYL